jgi:predicted enzyme related to lactoylglutathione lyase
MGYIAVANADETAAKVAKAGGTVVMQPFDVMEHGRMAVLQDPTGAHFSIWQPKKHGGTGITGVPGTLCWSELSTRDTSPAVKFYEEVFGWKVGTGKDNVYLEFKNGDTFIGGIRQAGPDEANIPPHWLLYFLVEDCDATTAQATNAGATPYVPPTTMEGVGRWAVIADPQSAVFAIFQPVTK